MSLGHCHSLGEVYFAPELARRHPYEGRENLLSSTNSFLSCVMCAWEHIFIGFNREGRKSVPLLVLYLMWLLTQVFLCSIWVITVIAVLYGDVKLNGYLMGIWFLCWFCFHGHQENDGANHGLFSNGGACIC